MRRLPAAAAALVLAACSRSTPPPPARETTPPPRITQFYTTTPRLPRGDKAMVCYGVENAKTVWLSPPRRELSAALARCVEVDPSETTTYTLTAEGAGGAAKQELTISIGAPRVKIIEVQVSSLEVKAGEPVSICWKVQNGTVRVSPKVEMAGRPECRIATPRRTTTYTVTATGAAGDRDEERVTVKVH